MAKYIFVAGGVISGTGKGVSAASIGLLLRSRGHNVTLIKFDPYLNTDAGVLAPREHGECFLCDDGTETDLDLGHYERIAGINVSKLNICTSGNLYEELIAEQKRGDYLGETIQVVPHVTNKIEKRLLKLGENHDIVIAEVGGTVGDNESDPFFEAISKFRLRNSKNVLMVLVAPVLWVQTIKEFKTKPLQNSVRDLRKYGLQPDVVFCRCDKELPENIIKKISDITSVPRGSVFDAPDVSSIYQVPIAFYDRHVDDLFVDLLNLQRTGCRIQKYKEVVEKYVNNNNMQTVNVGIFGKYDNCDEAYISLKEALIHAGIANDAKINIKWINAEDLEKYKDQRGIHKYFDELHGIIVPGGFDVRGIEGKIKSIQYVREKKIPFLGICLGLQCAVIEIARNILCHEDANSLEFNKNTKNPVVHFVAGQEKMDKKAATMRLGSYDCELDKDSIAYSLYESKIIKERHRHRYEVNNVYVEEFSKHDFNVTGRNPESNLIEIMELSQDVHPYFIGTQAHPEFKSRLTQAAPLFNGLIVASLKYKNIKSEKDIVEVNKI